MVDEEKLSQEFLDSLEKIRLELIARIKKGNFNQVDMVQLASQIDFFEELKSLGYTEALENYLKGYEDVILELKKQADRIMLQSFGFGLSVRDLDQFINVKADELLGHANQYAKELKSGLLRNLIAGTPINEIADSLNEIPLANTQLRVSLNTGIAEFERLGTAKIFEDAPETRFRLSGPKDIRTRASCEAVLRYQPKNGWTKEEIDKGAATKIVREHAKEFSENKSELEQALKTNYTFVDCGKWNCRHRFVVVE